MTEQDFKIEGGQITELMLNREGSRKRFVGALKDHPESAEMMERHLTETDRQGATREQLTEMVELMLRLVGPDEVNELTNGIIDLEPKSPFSSPAPAAVSDEELHHDDDDNDFFVWDHT